MPPSHATTYQIKRSCILRTLDSSSFITNTSTTMRRGKANHYPSSLHVYFAIHYLISIAKPRMDMIYTQDHPTSKMLHMHHKDGVECPRSTTIHNMCNKTPGLDI